MVCKIVVQYVDAQARSTFRIATNCNLPSFCYQRHNYLFPCRKLCICSLFWMICVWKKYCLAAISSNSINSNRGWVHQRYNKMCAKISSSTWVWQLLYVEAAVHFSDHPLAQALAQHLLGKHRSGSRGKPQMPLKRLALCLWIINLQFKKTVASHEWRVLRPRHWLKLRRKRCHC